MGTYSEHQEISRGEYRSFGGDLFENCVSEKGGAIANAGVVSFEAGGATFSGNSATSGQGGAIYNTGTINVYDSLYLATASDTIASAGTINFYLTERSGEDAALINDYSLVENTGTANIFLGAAQTGTYALAGNLSADDTFQVYLDDKFWGSADGISVGTTTIANHTFTLTQSGEITYSVAASEERKVVSATSSFSNLGFYGKSHQYAGAILKSNGSLTLTDSDFYYNSSTTGAGGAIRVEGGNADTFNNIRMVGNVSASMGGAVYTAKQLTVNTGFFVGNSGTKGGAIALNASAPGNISDAIFRSNTASSEGGALYTTGTSTVQNSTFEKNSSFTGGAIQNTGTLTLSGTTFMDNTAFSGAAVNNTGTLLVTGPLYFSGNDSFANGGAINNTGKLNVAGTVTLASDTDTICNAGTLVLDVSQRTGSDAALINDFSKIVNTGTIAVNLGTSQTGTYAVTDSFSKDDAFDVYVDGRYWSIPGGVSVGEETTIANHTILLSETGTVTQNVTASHAHMEITATTSLNGLAFYSLINTYGGAIVKKGTSTSLTLSDSDFYYTKSSNAGGAIRLEAGNTDTLTNLRMVGNTTGSIGGAIYSGTGKLNLSNSYFYGNKGVNNGGAIAMNNANASPTITGSTFTNNLTDGKGGALHFGTSGWPNATISNVIFSGNKAASGAAIYQGNGALTIKNCRFIGNVASSGKGGAYFYDNAGGVTFQDCSFETVNDSIYTSGSVKLKGKIDLAANITITGSGIIRLDANTDFTFLLDQRTTSSGAIFNYSKLTPQTFTATYKARISDTSDGKYTLLSNASGFSSTVTVYMDDDPTLSVSLSVGDSQKLGDSTVSLSKDASSNLCLTVTAPEAYSYAKTYLKNALVANYTDPVITATPILITGTTADRIEVSAGAIFYGYKGTTKRALSVSGGTANIDGAVFEANAIASGVGGVMTNTNSTTHISNSTFRNNSASVNGGVIYNNTGSASCVIITDSVFEGNSANDAAAIMNNQEGSLSISGSTFANNSVAGWGGAILSDKDASVTMDNVVFENNSATCGGAFFNRGSATLTNILFNGNQGWEKSGALDNSGGTVNLSGATFLTAGDSIFNSGELNISNYLELHSELIGDGTVNVAENADINLAGGTIAIDTAFVNEGTITVTADSVISLVSGSDLGTITVDGCALTVNVDNINSGVTYNDVTLINDATLTVTGTGHGEGNRVYYYNVVDASLNGTVGGEIDVTVKGESVKAIFGKNAFNSIGDVSGDILVTGGSFTSNQYANGNSLEITGGSVGSKQYFAGGAETTGGADAFTGDVTVSGTAVTGRGILGGGKLTVSTSGESVTGGTTSVVVSSTGDETLTVERLAGGALITSVNGGEFTEARSAQITATFDSFLTITGDDANTTDIAIGGSIVSGTADFTQVGNSTLAVSGGTFSTLAGGSYIGYKLAGVTVTGDTGVILSGGTVTGNIFGGNVSFYNGVNDSLGVTNTAVTIDATSEICFGESSNITAGNSTCKTVDKVATQVITGNATVTLTGSANNMVGFAGTIWGDCGKASAYANGSWDDHVAGDSILVFDDFTGTLNASRIACFDTYKTTGNTSVTIGSETNINAKGVSSWEIEYSGQEAAALTFDNSKISGDFSGDAIVLTKDAATELADDGWVVMQSKKSLLFTNIDKASITLFGEEAEKKSQTLDSADINDAAAITWASSNYELTYARDTESKYFQLTVTKLA